MQQIKLTKDVLTPQGVTLQAGTSYGVIEWANLGGGCHVYAGGTLVYIPDDAIAPPTEEEMRKWDSKCQALLRILKGENNE